MALCNPTLAILQRSFAVRELQRGCSISTISSYLDTQQAKTDLGPLADSRPAEVQPLGYGCMDGFLSGKSIEGRAVLRSLVNLQYVE
jgi:hypothetical protein